MMSYELILARRKDILQVFPELRNLMAEPTKSRCPSCRKKRIARAILTRVADLRKDGRDLGNLKGLI